MKRLFCIAVAMFVVSCAHTREARDVEALRQNILTYTAAVNAGHPERAVPLFAKDIITSFPGIRDADYKTLAEDYAEMGKLESGVTVTTQPHIEEILISGNLGIARIVWTTTTTRADPPSTTTRYMKDLQVWRRDPDGLWRFARGMHYRMKSPDGTGG
ncbi:MAG: DUF4440 domain-containing protein [Acidobacteriota bacterium]|nr:DUF4440 domain-containing protein [Acidobacteriota bacterium]